MKKAPKKQKKDSAKTQDKQYTTDTDISSQVSEPAVAYGRPYETALVILPGATEKPESQMTSFEKIDLINEGISKKDLVHLKEKSGLDYDQLANALSVARATLINKKTIQKFDKRLSEKIVGLAEVYSFGYEVFEDEEKFNRWMFSPNRSIGGKMPYDLLDNQYGREEIKNMIGRIAYGVYS